jgi:peptidylprolyl isomerase
MRIVPIALAAAALAQAATAQAPSPAAPAPAGASDWRPLDPDNTVVVDTARGRFVVELRPEIAPGHVARIKALTRQGYYNGSQFYRVLKGFMAQTGDKGDKRYRSELPNLKAEFDFALTPATPYAGFGASALGDLGFIGATPVVIDADPARPAGSPTSGRGYALFCPGTAAFAHGASPDSANSQIFFMRGVGGPTLERKFTAWGRVIHGQAVIEAIRDGEPPADPDRIARMRVLADIPAADRPRLQVMDTRGPAFAALLQQALAAKGPNASLCDVTVPVREE